MDFHVIIPARYASTRFPGKVLADLRGRPMLQHVYEAACDSGAASVIIATDDARVVEAAEKFSAKCCLTSSDHLSGTERIAEVAEAYAFEPSDILVNLQADEPLMPSKLIYQVANDLHQHERVYVSTLCTPILEKEDFLNPNVVKVVLNRRGNPLYFSRAPVPWQRGDEQGCPDSFADSSVYYRHIGIYAYRVSFLNEYAQWIPSPLEAVESLEQLRILWYGRKMHASITDVDVPPGVDTPEDLVAIEKLL